MPGNGCASQFTVCLIIPIKLKGIKSYLTVQMMKEGTEKINTVLPQILIFCKTELLGNLLSSKESLAQCEIPHERHAFFGFACSNKQVC